MEQKSKEWHDLKKTRIGSSEIAAIMGKSPYATSYDIWMEKTGRKAPFEGNEATKWGNQHEHEAREKLMQKLDMDFAPKVIIDQKNPFMASLDGINFEGDAIAEFKCPVKSNLLEKCIAGEIPEHYEIQVQWQLMLSKATLAYFCVYMPGKELFYIKMAPDYDLFRDMEQAALNFMKLVENDAPPAVTIKDAIPLEDGAKDVCEKYAKLLSEKGKIEAELKKLREDVLDFTDGGSAYGFGLTISVTNPKPCVDWDSYKEKKGIKDEDLIPFMKQKESFQTIKLAK